MFGEFKLPWLMPRADNHFRISGYPARHFFTPLRVGLFPLFVAVTVVRLRPQLRNLVPPEGIEPSSVGLEDLGRNTTGGGILNRCTVPPTPCYYDCLGSYGLGTP